MNVADGSPEEGVRPKDTKFRPVHVVFHKLQEFDPKLESCLFCFRSFDPPDLPFGERLRRSLESVVILLEDDDTLLEDSPGVSRDSPGG